MICIPKLALEIQDLSLPATVLLPRLDDNQPCRLWNEECLHGCGYIHLSSSTSSTKKKCCASGALSSVSHNFDEESKMRFGMDEMPLFMRLATTRRKFCQEYTKYIIIYLQWLLQRYATIVTILDLQIEVHVIIM